MWTVCEILFIWLAKQRIMPSVSLFNSSQLFIGDFSGENKEKDL